SLFSLRLSILYFLFRAFLPLRSSALLLIILFFFRVLPPPPTSTLFPYTTLFRSELRDALHEPRCRHDEAALALDRLEHDAGDVRSEEHTSELQSRRDLVCRLLLEKKKNLPYALSGVVTDVSSVGCVDERKSSRRGALHNALLTVSSTQMVIRHIS